MEISPTLKTTFSQVLRFLQIGYCIIPMLFGLFMALWGIFIHEGDWTLVVVGLAIFLIFGWGA